MTTPPRIIPRCFSPSEHVPQPIPRALESSLTPLANGWPTDDLRRGLTDNAGTALAGLLPAMVCGEESAVLVFHNEFRRAPADLFADSHTTLARISEEEAVHEEVLRTLASILPEASHEQRVRRLARRFFAGLHTPRIGDHFSRIAWLDSGVCIIFSRLLASPAIKTAHPLSQSLRRILREEASHVAFSRRYANHLGLDSLRDRESFLRVRGGLVQLLEPCADAFDALEVDADRLFAALRRRDFAAEASNS